MPQFFPGDVVLAFLRLGNGNESKVRPAIVIENKDAGYVILCPVTSKMPEDNTFVSLVLDDFEKGGLSIFDESYILLSENFKIRNSEILGKKGQLTKEKILSLKTAVNRH